MPQQTGDQITVLAFDIFGTTVDWRTGVADQVTEIAANSGAPLDGGEFADEWRDRSLPSMAQVRSGEREWVYLDTLHRETLDQLLDVHGVGDAFDDKARTLLVRAWHRLPPWDDSIAGLTRLRSRYVLAALSNGGFALLTHLLKVADLPFDCSVSAELARTYKPDPGVYHAVAGLLDVAPAQVMMVAAHAWDIDGARSAGLRTAFVERPAEKGPNRVADKAGDITSDLTVTGFVELAERLGC